MTYRIAVDTGGTFTDVVVTDAIGQMFFDKALTTHDRMFRGTRAALDVVSARIGLSTNDLLERSSLFIYATTRATNAIVERTTAPTAFFTTAGFPDVLRLREGGKPEPFDFQMPAPEPYVPARLTFEIGGRIGSEGEEIEPLNEQGVRDAVAKARAAGAESIAVCLLWSFSNPRHETRVRELIDEAWPGVPVTLSHELNPTIREYRRASSTAIDASLKPLMQAHLGAIERDLAEAGFGGELLVVSAAGGCLHADRAVERPIVTVGSGPSMAPVGARAYAEAEGGERDLIVCDSGGTTFDVSVVAGARVMTTRETWLGPRWVGDITGLSSIEVTSIGAGGGSIAWIDAGGLLRVGPESAGADPGPACYGRGGVDATVTDAATVLGYFDPDYFLGGRMTLELDAARAAVRDRVAEPLGLQVEEAAWAILSVANQAMVGAIREITINQGIDPRECTLVAGGGAGGLNAVMLAAELGCPEVLVPRAAGALSAAGAQFADIVAEATVSRYVESAAFDRDAARATLAELDARLNAIVNGLPVELRDAVRREVSVEARYPFQVWDIEVPLEPEGLPDDDALKRLVERFHVAHERNFAVREDGQGIEWQNWIGRITALLDSPDITAEPDAADALQAPPLMRRTTFFAGERYDETPCLDGAMLAPGARVEGPAVIEQPTTTIVVPPGSEATVTSIGSVLITTGDLA